MGLFIMREIGQFGHEYADNMAMNHELPPGQRADLW